MQPSAHILIVEDDADIRRMVADYLRRHGYRVRAARDGSDIERVLEVSHIDLFILDVMLPQEDGLSLCRRIRARTGAPIMMLSALGSEAERVRGLETGADDYLAKPFGAHELLARVRALLRRAQTMSRAPLTERRSRLSFSGWILDLAARSLASTDGVAVALTRGEFDLLVAFCEHPQRVLTREQLAELTRGKDAGVERSIDLQVSRLRRKIERDPRDPLLVQTVRAGGYVFTAEVSAS
jgi:two-component system, OmpR family, response regulator